MSLKIKPCNFFDYFFCLFSGILLSVSFTYNSFWWICFFGFVPFFIVFLQGKYSIFKFLQYVFAFSIGYYTLLMIWLLNISVLLPLSPIYAKLILALALIVIGLLQGIYLFIATVFFRYIRKNNYSDIFLFSFLFVLGEWFMENTPFLAFPWGKIGVIVTKYKPFIQSASIFGGMFISFLILIINGGIAYIIINIKNKKKIAFSFFITAAIFLLNISFGLLRIESKRNNNEFKAMVVQGNYSGLDKWETTTSEMFSTYLELTREGADKDTKLVIWPETAIPTRFYKNSDYYKKLITLADELDLTIVAGFYIDKNFEQSFNSLIAISPGDVVSNAYYKQILAPFGEYFPFGDIFKKILPVFAELIEERSGVIVGEKMQIIDTPIAKIGGIICYESIFSKLSAQSIKNGAQILAVASNDSWFGNSSALYQHLSHSIMRAVETNRFVLRASNTSITSIISPYGEIINFSEPFVKSYCNGYVYLNNDKTFYCKVGQIFLIPCFAVYFYSIKKVFFKNQRIKRKKCF